MDEEQVIKHTEALVVRLGTEVSESEKIKGMLEDAVILILDYTNRDKMTDQLYYYARQLVVITWNQEGNEGEASRSEGGVSQSFITDIPEKLKAGLNNYRLGKVVKYYAPKKT
ncbi:phage head-tail connector protein [Enterococcus sp. 5H]|uniref:phage head-tail connector protein n=1 Tax=Enterococcus sp. 5H TaxID=1229490 RepID=UPI00230485FB|nr:phage head-tail connector protein [Enterococcus sp. 5H]MDA9470581.1 Prophage protein [Enterococcus sp. 5H]